MKDLLRFTTLSLLLISSVSLHAQDSIPQSWAPTAPPPDKFDWVQLTSGEWLKGKIQALYDDTLEFDSEELDLQEFDLDDVAILRSYRWMHIRFNDRTEVTGLIELSGSQIQVKGISTTTHNTADILAMTPGGKERSAVWDGSITFGLNIRNGNTNSRDYSLRGDIQRRSTETRFKSSYVGNRTETEGIKTEENQRINASMDWFIGPRWFVRPLELEWYEDEFQNINHRVTYTASIGHHLIDNSKTTWDIYAGPGFQVIEYETVEANEDKREESSVGTLGTSLDYELTKDIDIDFLYNVQYVSEAAGNRIEHGELGLEIDITGNLDLNIRYYYDKVDQPKASETSVIPEKVDSRLTIGVSYDF